MAASQGAAMHYQTRFNYERLQKDLGFLLTDIPRLFSGLYGEEISKAAVYAWFARESMSVERLIQLLTIVRIETGKKLDVWRYIEVKRPAGTKAA
jgi:hypothetical protein